MQLTQVGFNLKRRAESPLSPEDINDDSGMETGSDQGMILVPATSSQSSADSPERSSQGEELFDEEDRVKKRLKSVTLEPPPIDYSTLCAFCDEPLPMNPSRSLQRLFEQIKPRARKQPRPTNPLGLTAPFTVYIQYCHNHRAEKNYIPDGLRRGWPKKIDFSAIRSRLQKPKNMKVLRMIVDGSGERAEWGKDGRGYFWDLAKYDVQSRGSRVANSVQGQMDTFETTQPGYYGEQGQMAISVAIDTLFPASTIAPASTSPLLLSDFRRRVLVPEAALLLIQEDMHAGRDEAMKIMNESRHYGLAMFPVRDTEEDFSLSLDNSLDVLSVEEKADHSLQHQVSDPLMTQNDEYLLPPARTPFKKDSPALLHDDAIQMADNRDSVLEGVNAHSLKVKKREPTSRPESEERKSKPTSSLFFDDPFESDDSSGVEDALHSVQHHIQVLETRSTAAKPSNPDTMISKSITRKGPSSSTPRGTDPERTARRTKMEKLAETRRKK
ncbi:hypothetical protein FRC02_002716 [Tulasnella sp. 418]|nr:hypothetical protein FRC02_002716 [Tulasnella sp. 418]